MKTEHKINFLLLRKNKITLKKKSGENTKNKKGECLEVVCGSLKNQHHEHSATGLGCVTPSMVRRIKGVPLRKNAKKTNEVFYGASFFKKLEETNKTK